MEVPLTQGHVALVDDEDAEIVLVHKWHARRDVDTGAFYAGRSVRSNGTKKTILLHTFLTGWPLTDHINGNGLDNRRSNLRPATNAQNGANERLRRNNTSGFKGVNWSRSKGKWTARIRTDDGRRHLGYYDRPDDAARAYDAAAREIQGEFACLNFPMPGERPARLAELGVPSGL